MKDAVGVIGGVGAMAGAYYMRRVFEFTKVEKDQDHINLLVYSHATIPDRTAFILGDSHDDPLPDLLADIHVLEALGCLFVTIPCNTAQYFYDHLQEHVAIPVINIVEETVKFIKKNHPEVQKVGILGTDGTIATEIYQNHLKKAGLEPIVPAGEEQKAVMAMIYDGVKSGKPVSEEQLSQSLEALRNKGAELIVLGCTELSVVKGDLHFHAKDVIDALDVLAYETVRRSGKPFVENVLSKF